ncbi:MAG TPA: hypothetical protein ENG33_01425 [Chloroflexi bacterium]|nr:hypothetical protein [Chloroflexota bacterium]
MSIVLVPIGEVDGKVLEFIGQALERTFGQPYSIAPATPLPAQAYNPYRHQYFSDLLLRLLEEVEAPGAERVLGVVDVDLYTEGLNFIFGQASLRGRDAIISLARLRQSFYGLPEDEDLFLERAVKEAVHELGHTYGLGHCPDPYCVMHFSNSLADTDVKQATFCPRCSQALRLSRRKRSASI